MSPAAIRIDNSRIGPSVSFDGLPESVDMLGDLAERGADMRPALRIIKELLIQGHRQQFATGGAFLGDPWPPNAPGTLARKAREGIPSLNRPMVASGALMESLSGGTGSRARVTRSMVSVGTSLYYAIFHIKGASGKGARSAAGSTGRRGDMPARPPVGINSVQRAAATAVIQRHIMGRL